MTDLRSINWVGCKAPEYALGRATIAAAANTMSDGYIRQHNWDHYYIPTYNQSWPSCVGEASANWLEMMIRRYVGRDAIPFNHQIFGEAIWRRARDMFWGGTYDDGLFLDQGFLAMIDMGMVPHGSFVVRVAPTNYAISVALDKTPLLQAHNVFDGWFYPKPNGQVNEGGVVKNFSGGHATCLFEQLWQNGAGYKMTQNSWGKDYGYNGSFIMSDVTWAKTLLDGPIYLQLPEGWERFEGWKQYVVPTPS